MAARVVLAVSALLVLCLAAPAAFADGKVFSQIAAAPTQIPDQSAIICWEPGEKGGPGTQTLVIETSFEGEGTEFGWVVPLPGQPLVRPATTGTIPSLRGVFLPKIERPLELFVPLLFLGLAFAAMLLRTAIGRIVGVTSALVLGGLVFMPALGTARSSVGGRAPGIEVLSREVVGNYDVTVVSAPNADALDSWLSDNGFAPIDDAAPVIRDYVQGGWVFACTRLTRETESGVNAPHPLVFTFESPRPIYPMRLTGVGQKRAIDLELFVFGSGTAAATGLTVVSSGAVERLDSTRSHRPIGRREVAISHPALAEIIPTDAAWGTKLAGQIAPAQMDRDMAIDFGEPLEIRRTAISKEGAATIGINSGATIFVLGFLVAAVALAAKVVTRQAAVRIGALGIALSIIVGIAVAAFLPSVAVAGRNAWLDPFHHVDKVHTAVLEAPDPVTLAKAQEIALALADANGFRIGDGPGEITLERVDGQLVFHWIDELGQRHSYATQLAIEP